jgi:hypothetical protein
MLNSEVLDVGVGLILVYLILGLMCTTVNEWIAQCLRARAKTLRDGIRTLLDAPLAAPPSLGPKDINAVKLVNRLATPGDKLAVVLGLDPAAMVGYRPRPEELVNAAKVLAERLDAALDDPALWQKIEVGKTTAKTLSMAQARLSGTRRRSVNLTLLREAYPDEITGLTQSFYRHPMIKSLARPGRHPSYVPAGVFAAVLTDILGNGRPPGTPSVDEASTVVDGTSSKDLMDAVSFSIAALPDGDIKQTLRILAQRADNRLEVFQKHLEGWFDDAMDRVSGWYKTKTQIITVIVAFGITIFANADTIKIARTLFLNPVLRAKIVQEASAAGGQERPGLTPQERMDLSELIGWSSEFNAFHRLKAEGRPPADIESAQSDDTFPGLAFFRDWRLSARWLWSIVPDHLIGWFMTGVAASLGAPFWFDTLNRFMNIRAAGTAPNEKGQDRSKA